MSEETKLDTEKSRAIDLSRGDRGALVVNNYKDRAVEYVSVSKIELENIRNLDSHDWLLTSIGLSICSASGWQLLMSYFSGTGQRNEPLLIACAVCFLAGCLLAFVGWRQRRQKRQWIQDVLTERPVNRS